MTAPIPSVLCFDVEDIISPEADDAALFMADSLTEHGLTGSFMVMGELARLWERRGRRDVIEALKRHDLAFHSTWHSVHPTTTEVCLDHDFEAGIATLWEREREGFMAAERILGRPLLGWARTGSSWSPSIMGLMARMGRAYAYSVARLPGHDICWYANCLSFYGAGIGGFDDTFRDDSAFEARLAQTSHGVDEFRRSGRRGATWLCFFMCHPTRTVHTAFWDAVNFSRGANPPRRAWKPAPALPVSEIPTVRRNFGRLCERLQADDRLEIVGWGDLIRRYDGQRPFATHSELLDAARRIADHRRVLFTDHFTAAELLLMLCQAAVSPAERYVRQEVYGPLSLPAAGPTKEFDPADLQRAAQALVAQTKLPGCLPATVRVGGGGAGIGTVIVALAEMLLGTKRPSGPPDAPYPPEAEEISRTAAEAIPAWIIHPDDMDLTNLLEQTRLQCWALKPAWPRDAL